MSYHLVNRTLMQLIILSMDQIVATSISRNQFIRSNATTVPASH